MNHLICIWFIAKEGHTAKVKQSLHFDGRIAIMWNMYLKIDYEV